MRRALLTLAVVAAAAIAGLSSQPALADVAFPARLEVVEKTPGSYEVTFTLPVVEGRKLRARPSLPPTCRDLGEREVTVSSAGHTLRWTTLCDPATLAGEAILVEGLLGTQTDLAFTLTTLDGRVYSEILRPSRPGFLVPEPLSLPGLAAEAAVAGMRRILRQLPLWVLLAVAGLGGARARDLAVAVGVFAVAHALGQWLGGNSWLQIPLPQRDIFVLTTVAVPAAGMAGAGERWRGWLQPLWPVAALIGLLYGGASPEALPPGGLSNSEQLTALLLFGAGVALGLVLMAAAAVELDAVLRLAGAGRWRERGSRWLGYAIGAAATGALLATILALALLPTGGRGAPLELLLLAALLGPCLAAVGRSHLWMVLIFAAFAGLGVTAGLLRLPLPLGSTPVIATLLILGASVALDRPLPARWTVAVAAVAIPAHAWLVTGSLVEYVSRSTGAAVGATVLGTCVFYASLAVSRGGMQDSGCRVQDAGFRIQAGGFSSGVRLFGAGIVGLAVAARLAEYRAWFDRQLATEFALGLVRLPVLALALAVAAFLIWPRKRRVLSELGVEQGPRTVHWLLLGAAWLALPYGTVAVSNPWFEPHAPRGEDARRVAVRVLSDTYHAFNLEDEDELYDRLADSVSGELIDDLYLDSRRRLTAGAREGAQVTVRDVSVLSIGEPDDDGGGSTTFAYDCRWVVTARVQHLQHVHHRRNVYNGLLTLRIDGERWKIAHVELYSEEREVVPWQAG